MPCRTEMFHCHHCGGEHYMANECLTDPTKRGEGLKGYNSKTASLDVDGALCDVLSLLEEKNLLTTADVPEDIMRWWKEHQYGEREKLKAEALAKLSDKEKRALGLK